MPQQAVSLEQAIQTIQQLMKEQQWLEAHRACLEVLHYDPENIKVIHLKNKIEKKVSQINKKAVQTDINNLKPLWQEHRYEELLKNLKHLEPYIPDFPQLKNLIVKAQRLYVEQLRGTQQTAYQTETKNIDALLKENRYAEALLTAERLRVMGIHENELKGLVAKIRSRWIDSEIEQNKALLSGKKYEDILFFYQKLLKIDPDSAKLKNTIEQTKKTYQAFKIEEKKEFIYKSLEEIRTLFQLKKYEKVYQAAMEILEIDPQNKSALSFQKRAVVKNQKVIDNEVITQMLNNQKDLKQEYKADKKSFIRL